MCGINGLINFIPRDSGFNRKSIVEMNNKIIHRGPDETGIYYDEYCGIGMRRLSIIDLAGGSQPVYNETKRMFIVLNGEIYNYKKLAKLVQDKGHTLKSSSDTEVVLHLFEEFGPEAVNMLNGMFAFAIYDLDKRELFVARDRAGEKPFYYTEIDGAFVFASELKSIIKVFDKKWEINKKALSTYLQLSYIPSPMSIIDGISKLPAGHWMTVKKDGIEQKQYWDIKPDESKQHLSYDEHKKLLRKTFTNTVEEMMVSDVPLGSFLSGGIDSTIVTGLMSKISSRKINSFSVGFKEKEFDETDRALAVSSFLKTNHQVITLDYKTSLDWMSKVVDNIDEPFSDSSCLPTYFVSQFAKKYVTVTLTGDGGDEMFAGYSKHMIGYYSTKYKKIPSFIRSGIIEPFIRRLPDKTSFTRKVKKVIRNNQFDIFTQRKNLMKLGFQDIETVLSEEYLDNESLDFVKPVYKKYMNNDELTQALYTDAKIVLEGDMLTKVDRMSMLASLETRAPFLSKEMMELAFSTPSEYKIKGKNQKAILKDTFSDLFPPKLLDMPKHGFAVPVDIWFKTTMKEEIKAVLNEDSIKEQGIFNWTAVKKTMEEHFSENENNGYKLWNLYIFQKWYRKYLNE